MRTKMYRSKGIKLPYFKLTAFYTFSEGGDDILNEVLGATIEHSAIISSEVKDGGKFEDLLGEVEFSLSMFLGRTFGVSKDFVDQTGLDTDSPINDYPLAKFFFGEKVTVEDYNNYVLNTKARLEFDGEDTSEMYKYNFSQEELDEFSNLIVISSSLPNGLDKMGKIFSAGSIVEFVDDNGLTQPVTFYYDSVKDKELLSI